MKRYRRIFSVFLVLIMVLGILPTPTLAGTGDLNLNYNTWTGTPALSWASLTDAVSYSLTITDTATSQTAYTDTNAVSPVEVAQTAIPTGTYTATVVAYNSSSVQIASETTNPFDYTATAVATYSVTYYAGEGSGSVPTDATEYHLNDSVTVQSPTELTPPTGKCFSHWNTQADNTGYSYAPGATFTIAFDTALYAQYIDGFTLTYDVNGGVGTVPTDANGYVEGESALVQDGTGLTRDNGSMLFSHWNTLENGYGISYKADQICTMSGNTTLYAQYITGIKVSYDANGGSNAPASSALFVPGNFVTLDSGNNLTPPSGKIFTGWNTQSDGSGTSYDDDGSYVFESDTILYAQYADVGLPTVERIGVARENGGAYISLILSDTPLEGTMYYYAISTVTDGTTNAADIVNPPTYGSVIQQSGKGGLQNPTYFGVSSLDNHTQYYISVVLTYGDILSTVSVAQIDTFTPLTITPSASGGSYNASSNTLSVSGATTVTLTMSKAFEPFCDSHENLSITAVGSSGLTYTVTLPNISDTYHFGAEGDGDTAECTVSVTKVNTAPAPSEPTHICSYSLTYNGDYHWYQCVDGDSTYGKEEHYSTSPATYTSAEYCAVCGYMMRAKLPAVKTYTLTIDYTTRLPSGANLQLENLSLKVEKGTVVDLSDYFPAVMEFDVDGKTYYFSNFHKDSPLTVTSDITVIASYSTTKYYTVTFDSNGGSVIPKAMRIKEGASLSTAVKKVIPTCTGKEFVRWQLNGKQVSGNASADVTLVAGWEQLVAITFDPNNGEAATVKYYKEGRTVTAPTDPEKDGYIFTGWYTDPGYSALFNFSQRIYADQTLYAGWAKAGEVYYLTVNYMDRMPQDAKLNIPTKRIPLQRGCTVDLSAYFPSYLDCEIGEDIYYFDGFVDYRDNLITMDENKTVYASWTTETTYTLILDPEGGEVSPTKLRVKDGLDVSYALQKYLPTRNGYVFVGWVRSDGKAYSIDLDSNLVATAVWKLPNRNTITFDPDNGDAKWYLIVKRSETVSEPETPTREGYVFDGWSSSPSGLKFDSTKVKKDYTLTAQWIKTHPVTFVPNNGKDATVVEIVTGQTVQKPANPTKANYKFTGWYTDRECTTKYDFASKVTNPLTLYAGWEIKYYILKINYTYYLPDGATTKLQYITKRYEAGTVVDLSAFIPDSNQRTVHIRNGKEYYFDGFGYDKTGPTLNTVTMTGNIHLYARWSKSRHRIVTLDANGGSVIPEKFVLTTTLPEALENILPTFEGYVFDGWTRSDGKELSELVNKDITLTAGWIAEKDLITLTFEPNNGADATLLKVKKHTEVDAPADPTKEGYLFTGWYKNNSKSHKIDFPTTFSHNTTLTAGWEKAEEKVYKLTLIYDPDDADNSKKEYTFTQGTEVDLSAFFPENLTKEESGRSMYFAGFTPADIFSTTIHVAIMNADKTYYALWTPQKIKVQIILDANGGEVFPQATMVDADMTLLDVYSLYEPTRKNYTFDRWESVEPIDEDASFGECGYDPITLVAQWKNSTIAATDDNGAAKVPIDYQDNDTIAVQDGVDFIGKVTVDMGVYVDKELKFNATNIEFADTLTVKNLNDVTVSLKEDAVSNLRDDMKDTGATAFSLDSDWWDADPIMYAGMLSGIIRGNAVALSAFSVNTCLHREDAVKYIMRGSVRYTVSFRADETVDGDQSLIYADLNERNTAAYKVVTDTNGSVTFEKKSVSIVTNNNLTSVTVYSDSNSEYLIVYTPEESADDTADDTPQTGDISHTSLYLAGMMLALLGMGITVVVTRKSKKQR